MQTLQPHDTDESADYRELHDGQEPTNWEDVTFFDEEGYGIVHVNQLGGFINRQGEVVIPLIYDHYARTIYLSSVSTENGESSTETMKPSSHLNMMTAATLLMGKSLPAKMEDMVY